MELIIAFVLMCLATALIAYALGTRNAGVKVSYPAPRSFSLANVQDRFDVYIALIDGACGSIALDHIKTEIQQVGLFEANVEAILFERIEERRRNPLDSVL